MDWSTLREIVGDARAVPDAVEALVSADSEEAIEKAYWRLDNHVVVQGQLFESALPLVPVLLALLAGELGEQVRANLLEFLYQIAIGEPDESELRSGNPDLGKRVKAEVAKGLWLYYIDLLGDKLSVQKVALELVKECESDERRLRLVLERCAKFADNPEVRSLAFSLIEELRSANTDLHDNERLTMIDLDSEEA